MPIRKYRKRENQLVVAICLDLETDGFSYRKWGSQQRCKRGDWVVNNAGDIYTVDAKVFQRTYREIGKGHYVKTTPIWAEVATTNGAIETKEGRSSYEAGDYLVFNHENKTDGYCMSATKFESKYELDE
jgi:hypothetical protein